MAVVMALPQGDGDAIGLTGAGAFVLAEGAALDQALHVVVVALLRRSHLGLKAQHLGAVFAEGAVHLRLTTHHLHHPLAEGLDHQRVIAQIGGVDKLHLRVIGGHQSGVLANATDQHPRKQEVGKHHDAAEAEAHRMPKARLHQREGHAGIQGFAPAEAEALHQHPRHLGNVGVGVRVGRAATHHHQQGLAEGHRRRGICGIQGLADARPGRLDHLEIDAELAAVIDAQAGFSRIGVEHRRDVVFGMTRGEQHPGYRQHPPHPLGPQALQAVAQDRSRELQVAVFDRHLGQQPPQPLSQLGELGHGLAVAAAMAADHHPDRTALHTVEIQLHCGFCHGKTCLDRPYRPPPQRPRPRGSGAAELGRTLNRAGLVPQVC